ncbi:transposase [Candidatus Thiosymbion oneisti]|uniref:transposase n=1 Tax=Candidatus Thiosymbion oneisti TaxID=589554 RepID=UPI001414D392|nr:transposase [Candidatus Thiosymbion oneisti]
MEWLQEGLVPSYRTSAEFRRVNGSALRAANRDFIVLCQELDLLGRETIGIDGSFFQASASDASIKTKKRLETELKKIERDLDAYAQCLDANDAQENQAGDRLGEDPALVSKLDELKAHQARQQAQRKQLEERGETQRSRTDPDARALNKGKQHVTGYNVQSGVDGKHQLIVHHEVTNAGNDQNQLSRQCQQTMAVLGVESLTVVADAGYYSEVELAACDAAGATVYVPIPDKHKAVTGQGRLSGKRFQYNQTNDVYICPAGELLPPRGQPHHKNGIRRTRYSHPASQCRDCLLKAVCRPDSGTPRVAFTAVSTPT